MAADVAEDMYRGPRVVARLVAEQAARLADRPAITTSTETLSYADLANSASRFAAGLQELGVRAGDRIATMATGASSQYLASWFGIAWSGAVEVPVNPMLKGDLLGHVLTHSDPSMLIVASDRLQQVKELRLASQLKIVVIDGADPEPGGGAFGFDELTAVEGCAPVDRGEDDLAWIIYTSGTTGPSKGVVHTNGSALANAKTAVDALQLRATDVIYCYFPLYHISGRAFCVMAPMWTGGRVCLSDKFSVTDFWRVAADVEATWTVAVGGILQLLDARDPSPADRRHGLRLIASGRVPPELHTRFENRFGVELLDMYGLTETGTVSSPNVGEPKHIGTTGRARPAFEIEVHDDHDRPVEAGTVGEIVVRPREPDVMFRSYWRQPDETVHAFRNLWFHTGDAGVLEPGGYLRIVDRIKDSIRRLGENISSFEVESVVNQHPDILESAAFPVRPGPGDEEVMVAAVVRRGRTIDPNDFVAFCAEKLPPFAVPRFLRKVGGLPKNHSERVEKYVLRDAGVTPDTVDLRELLRARQQNDREGGNKSSSRS